jgi:hypothetical protein
MRWRLFIEEYSHDLQNIIGENNVAADVLSCLPQTSTSCEDSQESYYDLVEYHEYKNKKTDKYDFHPLLYEHLEFVQKRDPELKKNFRIIPVNRN